VIATEGPEEGPKGQDRDQPPGVEIRPAMGAARPDRDMEMDGPNSEASLASPMAPRNGVMSSAVTKRPKFTKRRRDQDGLTKPIGELLIDSGLLKRAQLEEILRVQASSQSWGPRKRFGEIARELGLVEGSRVDLALARQFDLPSLPPSDRTLTAELVAARETNHPGVEVLRGVRERIAQTWLNARGTGAAAGSEPRSGGHAVAIVSPQRGDGRSFIAANLAITFAQGGRRTLLIDADQFRDWDRRSSHGLTAGALCREDGEAPCQAGESENTGHQHRQRGDQGASHEPPACCLRDFHHFAAA